MEQFLCGLTLIEVCLPKLYLIFNRFGVLIRVKLRYATGVCWQSRYVLHKGIHTVNGGKLVLELFWELGNMVPRNPCELYLDNGSKYFDFC